MNRFMLDTDLSIYVINRRPREALDTFNAHAGEICISAITLAELRHGRGEERQPDQDTPPGGGLHVTAERHGVR